MLEADREICVERFQCQTVEVTGVTGEIRALFSNRAHAVGSTTAKIGFFDRKRQDIHGRSEHSLTG